MSYTHQNSTRPPVETGGRVINKVNHSAVYIKLMKGNIPVELLGLLEY